MMKSTHAVRSHTRKRLSVLNIVFGVVVLVLISSALAVGQYLSQGDTDSRSQAAGKQWFCRNYEYVGNDCSGEHIYVGARQVIISDENPTRSCEQTSSTRSKWFYCWENIREGDGNSGPCRPESATFCQDSSQSRTNSNVCKCVALTGGSNGAPINYGWNCASQDPIKCPVAGANTGGTTGSTGTGSGGGSGNTGGGVGGGGDSGNTWASRTVVGQIKCTNVAGMTAPLNQPYAIANVPIRTFWGGSAVPTSVLSSATTNAQGIYSMSLSSQDPKFTVRVSNNNQDHDYAFYRKKPSSLSGVTCYDNNAYELCDYLNIAAGTTKAGFDFETNVRAENLRGYQSGTNYVFEFKQAKDYVNTPIKKYVVRLDNKADGWYSASSDYYLTVPRTDAGGTGTCSGGVCKITSAELNAIKTFKFGTYGMGVNPIWNSHTSGQSPIVELCRNDATIQAHVSQAGTPPVALPTCGVGLTCSASAVTGATVCSSTNPANPVFYCCKSGQVILNGKCATVGNLRLN